MVDHAVKFKPGGKVYNVIFVTSASLYFVMTSLTSVGFGNIAANTKSEQERTFKIFGYVPSGLTENDQNLTEKINNEISDLVFGMVWITLVSRSHSILLGQTRIESKDPKYLSCSSSKLEKNRSVKTAESV